MSGVALRRERRRPVALTAKLRAGEQPPPKTCFAISAVRVPVFAERGHVWPAVMLGHRPPFEQMPPSRSRPGSRNAFATEYFEPVAVAGDDLGAPLLRTKLVVPSSPRLVVRESLIDALSEGLSQPLTLVYGPAGSGKTMLVAQWAASAREERPVAWLSVGGGR